MAPVQARGWAERLIGDFGRSSRASAASAKRNRATGGAGDLAERGEEPIEADLSGDRNDAAEPDQPDRRAGDDELTEVERRLVAKGNGRQAAELRYEPEEPVEAFEPIELPEIEVDLAELTPQEDVPPPVPIEVEPFELPDGEGERPREEEQPSPVPIEVEPFELPDREGEQPRDETQPPPDAIDVEPVALPDEEDARPGEERSPLAPIGVESIEVPEVEVVQPEPQDSPEPIEVEVWTDEVPGSDRHPREER